MQLSGHTDAQIQHDSSRAEKDFLEAFDAYADALFRHALFRLSDRERARDLTQDTFLKAWDFVSQGNTVQAYRAFLYHILNNLVIDEYRKKRPVSLDALLENEAGARTLEAHLSEGGREEIEDSHDRERQAAHVRSRISELPEQHYIAIVLRFIDGLSISEIAEAIGVSENAASVRVHRALAALRNNVVDPA